MTHDFRSCPDSEGLGSYGNGNIIIGYVSEVNGPDSGEVPDFVPTRHELIQLFKYWATLDLDKQFYFFLYTQTGSIDRRRGAFAGRRICRIAAILGEEEVQKAIQEAQREYNKKIDPRAWSIFQDGTPEERDAFQEEVQRSFS
jgi:hypothetical protein